MWAMWHASRQAARTPVELNASAGWFPFRLAVMDATVFTSKRVEGAALFDHVPPNPLRSGWGLTQSTG